MESPFDILRIDSDADDAEIERAYRRRVKEAHPDRGGSAEEFQAVRAAYEELASGSRPATRDSDGADRDDVSPGDTPAGDTPSGEADSDDTADRRPRNAQVEYLDYAVLDDYGWRLDDEDLFEKASEEPLEPPDYGQITVEIDELLLEAAEDRGFTWPYSCRGGACANCAVAVKAGEISMPSNHVLPPEMLDRGIRLSCIGTPTPGELQVVYNVKHMPELDELRLPPGPFEHIDD